MSKLAFGKRFFRKPWGAFFKVKKEKSVILVFLLLVALALAGYLGLARAADQEEPGSRLDPLVTKSFVEKYVRDALGAAGSGDFQWRIKNLSAGQEFLGGAGTEFIVRTGSAVIIDPTGSGVPDLTSGTNAGSGEAVALNHLYLVPRADGRGIRAQSGVIVMFRGGGVR
ncbi:MAG: hypothetical protein K6U74_00905 [Firmicutes bacterium]|nr:hypothetical protein [Bacillota bacterium]